MLILLWLEWTDIRPQSLQVMAARLQIPVAGAATDGHEAEIDIVWSQGRIDSDKLGRREEGYMHIL